MMRERGRLLASRVLGARLLHVVTSRARSDSHSRAASVVSANGSRWSERRPQEDRDRGRGPMPGPSAGRGGRTPSMRPSSAARTARDSVSGPSSEATASKPAAVFFVRATFRAAGASSRSTCRRCPSPRKVPFHRGRWMRCTAAARGHSRGSCTEATLHPSLPSP